MNIAKYTDPKAWLRGLLKNAVHAGTGAILAGFGTNGIEAMTPDKWATYTKGIGLGLEQMAAVFVVSALLAAVRFINETTEEVNTTPPIPKP